MKKRPPPKAITISGFPCIYLYNFINYKGRGKELNSSAGTRKYRMIQYRITHTAKRVNDGKKETVIIKEKSPKCETFEEHTWYP
uniref:Uncharacterized protein n=1 Tax=Octopus bimaculoides TaxID=37653 RepID=A0A0L8HRB9_OCTBM